MNLAKIQQEIRNQKLDGWLFFDHHLRDPLAYRVLGLHARQRPIAPLVLHDSRPGRAARAWSTASSAISWRALPGEKIAYSSWTEQLAALGKLTAGMKRVAMQYSPMCAIPYVAMVDAGTVDLVRSLGVEVVSSAELIQTFEARWTPEQLESHLEAGRRVDNVRAEAFELIRERTRNGVPLQEVEVKDFVRKGFADAGLLTDNGPIVGCNANASNPHYEPSAEVTAADQARRLGAARYVGQARSARRGLLRHHLDGLLRRQSDRRDAPRLRHRARRARRRHQARDRRHGAGPHAARLRGGRRLPRRDHQGRLRRVLHAPHRPLHRRRSPRQRRQHGQLRDPRRAARHAVELLLRRARHLPAELRRALGDQHVHRRPRRAVTGEIQREMVLL